MKQPGLLVICGIVLMSSIINPAAQTTPDPKECEPGMEFIKISYNDITLSWKRECFKNSTSYEIDLFGNSDCTDPSFHYECETEKCEISITDMDNCIVNPIRPCSSVTFKVTGDKDTEPKTITTTVAPRFKSFDWKLHVNQSDGILHAFWGPAENSTNNTKCATKASVSATCSGNEQIKEMILNTTQQGTAQFEITECNNEENIIVTVTYITGGVLTETQKSASIIYYTATNGPSPADENGLGGGEIAGIVIGSLAGVCLIVGLIAFIYKKNLANRGI